MKEENSQSSKSEKSPGCGKSPGSTFSWTKYKSLKTTSNLPKMAANSQFKKVVKSPDMTKYFCNKTSESDNAISSQGEVTDKTVSSQGEITDSIADSQGSESATASQDLRTSQATNYNLGFSQCSSLDSIDSFCLASSQASVDNSCIDLSQTSNDGSDCMKAPTPGSRHTEQMVIYSCS